MNGQSMLFTLVVMAQAAACATARAPTGRPPRCTEKPADKTTSRIESSPADREETALNAKRWPLATYFNRLKGKIREHWKPVEEYRRNDPDGSRYGEQDRTTLVHVSLRADGSLDRVMIDHSSGLDFLDELAVEAFQNAQPFGEPPCQLIQSTGLVEFSFWFRLDVARPAMKAPGTDPPR